MERLLKYAFDSSDDDNQDNATFPMPDLLIPPEEIDHNIGQVLQPVIEGMQIIEHIITGGGL